MQISFFAILTWINSIFRGPLNAPLPLCRRNRKKFHGGSGCKEVKMSPSLFNFVEAKDKFAVRSRRIMFLIQSMCN